MKKTKMQAVKDDLKNGLTLAKTINIRTVFLALAVIIVLGGVIGVLTYGLSNAKMEETMAVALNSAEASAEYDLDRYRAYVQMMALDTRITSVATPARLSEICQEFIAAYGLQDAYLITKQGSRYDSAELDAVGQACFNSARGETVYISEPVVVSGQDAAVYLAAAIDNDTGYGGTLVVALPMDRFNVLAGKIAFGETGYAMVVDAGGNVISHRDQALAAACTNFGMLAQSDSAYEGLAAAVGTMLAEPSGDLRCKDESGKALRGAFAEIANSDGWKICVLAENSELMRSFYYVLLVLAACFLIAVGSTFITSKLIAKKIGAPVQQLSGRLSSLSKGDLTPFDGGDQNIRELATLGNSLKKTIDNLNVYISDIHQTLGRMAGNDYDVEITREYVGDFAQIKTSLTNIIDSLNATMRNIGKTSERVHDASGVVAMTSQSMAQGATEQASAVEELLSTINGISEQFGETAKHAENANQKAAFVRSQMTMSNRQMNQLIQAMSDIGDTSNQVAEIVKIIEDIAFQTNILALNAAVEAARAGINGKSFAVVADEVKRLATKCAKAAEDTTALIQDTISAVERGMEISTQTADQMNTVVAAVDEVADGMMQISRASAEESEAITQVVQGLDQVSTVVQANSATAEESAAVSHELAAHADKLASIVGSVKLKKETAKA